VKKSIAALILLAGVAWWLEPVADFSGLAFVDPEPPHRESVAPKYLPNYATTAGTSSGTVSFVSTANPSTVFCTTTGPSTTLATR
jgi:hypothetical protein